MWICPHVEPCSHRAMCANATFLGRPVKPEHQPKKPSAFRGAEKNHDQMRIPVDD